jgi:hypothetical protein
VYSRQGPCNLKVNGILEGTALFDPVRADVWRYALVISMRVCGLFNNAAYTTSNGGVFTEDEVFYLLVIYLTTCGPGSIVGIVTGYGLDGPGLKPGGGEIFRTSPDRPSGPPSGYRVFPGGKERPGRDADPSPPSSAVVMSTPPTGRTACTEPQCLYKGALYFLPFNDMVRKSV